MYEHRKHYFPEVREDSPVAISQFRLPSALSVGFIRQQLGIETEALRELNYALSDAIWAGRYKIPAGYNLKVPAAYATKLSRLGGHEPAIMQARALHATPASGGATYTVKSGDTLSGIAKKHQISVERLVELNGLKDHNVRLGQTLKVKVAEQAITPKPVESPQATVSAPAVHEEKMPTPAASRKTKIYRV